MREQLHIIGRQAVGALALEIYHAVGTGLKERLPCHGGGEIVPHVHLGGGFGIRSAVGEFHIHGALLHRHGLFRHGPETGLAHHHPAASESVLIPPIAINGAVVAAHIAVVHGRFRLAEWSNPAPPVAFDGLRRLVEHGHGAFHSGVGAYHEAAFLSGTCAVREAGEGERQFPGYDGQPERPCVLVYAAVAEPHHVE